jgi:hypothetical protein
MLLLYLVTQYAAIDELQTKNYVRLIPFAIVTGVATGFALDTVPRKLRAAAEGGFPPTPRRTEEKTD